MNIALIPARGGSKRIPRKNVRMLHGHPLVAYSIHLALKSGLFSHVIVSTEDEEIAEVAQKYGACIPGLRPQELSEDLSPDISWVTHAINTWSEIGSDDTIFLLRPTNPLRSVTSLLAARDAFEANPSVDSLRAMQRVREHPGKMWVKQENGLVHPFLRQVELTLPTHSSPTQMLESIYIQNASLEVFKAKLVLDTSTITGDLILPFEMPGYESFDLNTQFDWDFLIYGLDKGFLELPQIDERDSI